MIYCSLNIDKLLNLKIRTEQPELVHECVYESRTSSILGEFHSIKKCSICGKHQSLYDAFYDDTYMGESTIDDEDFTNLSNPLFP